MLSVEQSSAITSGLNKLSNLTPSLDKFLISLSGIEGIDQAKITKLGEALQIISTIKPQEFDELVRSDNKEAINAYLKNFLNAYTLVREASVALNEDIKRVKPDLTKSFEGSVDQLKGVLLTEIPQALSALNVQLGQMNELTIDVSPAKSALETVKNTLNDILKLKAQVEGKPVPVASTTSGTTATTSIPQAVTTPVVQAQVAATYKPGSSPEELINKSQQQVEPIEVPVQFKGIKEYEEWYNEYVRKYKELPDLSLASKYDYQKALAAGVKPERVEDGTYHWPSKTPEGEWLKLEGHSTRWKEEVFQASQEAGDALQTNVGGTLTDIKGKFEEKLKLVLDITQATAALDVVIAKLKEIVEWVKSIGKIPIQVTQQVSQQVNAPDNQTGIQGSRTVISAAVKPVLDKSELDKTVQQASTELKSKPVNLAVTTDDKVLSDQVDIMKEFNRQQEKSGNRQLDIAKISKQINAQGLSYNQIVAEQNKLLEEQGENYRFEPQFVAKGKSYQEQLDAMMDLNIRNTKGFKIPVEYDFKELIEPTFDYRDFRVPIAAEWKFTPEQLLEEQDIKDFKVPVLSEWKLTPDQLLGEEALPELNLNINPEWAQDPAKFVEEIPAEQQVKVTPVKESYADELTWIIEDAKQQVPKQTVPVFTELELQQWNQKKLESLWIGKLPEVKVPILPEFDPTKVVSGIEMSLKDSGAGLQEEKRKIAEQLKSRWEDLKSWVSGLFSSEQIDVPVTTNLENKSEDLNGFKDSVIKIVNEVKSYISSVEISPNLKLSFGQEVYKAQLNSLVEEVNKVKAEIEEKKLQLSFAIEGLNADDPTQNPVVETLQTQISSLDTYLVQLQEKVNLFAQEYTKLVSVPPVAPENANPLESIIAAVTAGKNAVVNSVGSITNSISSTLTPVITQVQAAMNLGVLALDVTPAITALTTLISLLQQAITLKGQLGTIGGAGTEGAEIQSNAAGGYIAGPGTSVSDSILSWLSNGEYIVDALTTKFFGPGFFKGLQESAKKGRIPDQLRSNKFSKGGSVDKNLLAAFKLPKFSKGGYVSKLRKDIISIPAIKLPKFATGGLVGATSGVDYAKLGVSRQAALATGTPVNLTIYDHKYELRAQPSVADQLRKALSLEALKRGRR